MDALENRPLDAPGYESGSPRRAKFSGVHYIAGVYSPQKVVWAGGVVLEDFSAIPDKIRIQDAVLAADLLHLHAGVGLLQDVDDLAFSVSAFLHRSLLAVIPPENSSFSLRHKWGSLR